MNLLCAPGENLPKLLDEMPHATVAAAGFQAIILCGPGESLQPFNSNPDDFPKALIPIANRPMVWYPLEWCHRMGISNIILITASSSSQALESALSTNPHLTSLPSPKPTVLAPPALTLTTGTAELFRMQEVQDAITDDFMILPCDLVCEMSGLSLLEDWLILLGGLSQNSEEEERQGRRGGLGVWYQTKDTTAEGGVGVKKEETDFLATAELPRPVATPAASSLRLSTEDVVLTMPTAALKERIVEDKGLKLRHAAVRKSGKLKMRTSMRDAHIYFFPHWVKEYMRRNETFDSVSEDVLGWWAKAGWQDGLAHKLGLDQVIGKVKRRPSRRSSRVEGAEAFIDVASLSSTSHSIHDAAVAQARSPSSLNSFASRVPNRPVETPLPTLAVPHLLAYIHPAQPSASLLRRIDTVQLLLSASLFLAKLPPASESVSPFAYEHKIHPSSTPSPDLRLTLDQRNVLMDANVTLTSKSTIKESVVGFGCVLGTPMQAPVEGANPQEANRNAPAGVRLQRCLLMDGAIVEAGAVLNGCVLGRRCRVGKGCELKDCVIQEGYVVAEGSISKGEIFAGFGEEEGLNDDEGMLSQDDDAGELAL